MTTATVGREPSGCEEFDRALALLDEHRDEEALDWFEIASDVADDGPVRASAAAHAAAILLASGRAFEAEAWAASVRRHGPSRQLADLLEASARIQRDDLDGALQLLGSVEEPSDPWFPCSPATTRIVRGHALWLAGRRDDATTEVAGALAHDPASPEVWHALARVCAETDFDPSPAVARVSEELVVEVCAWLRSAAPTGADRIAEELWRRSPGDTRVLALGSLLAPALPAPRCAEWTVRLRENGAGGCPLLVRARDLGVDPAERARCAALAASFADGHEVRIALEDAVGVLADDRLAAMLGEVLTLDADLADSVIVAGAVTTARSLALASVLHAHGATPQGYAVLVHGLCLEGADDLDAATFAALVPVATLEAFASEAFARGETDVAAVLAAVLDDLQDA